MILKDCLEKIIDNRGKNPKYYDREVYPVIDNVMIKNNYHPNINEATRFIDQDTHDNFLRGYLESNIPIMTLVGGGIGNVSLSIDDKSVIVQNTIGFKTKPELLDSIYLYYWFLYKHDELIQFNRGSGQPSIRKTDIENMNIELKSINYQRKASKILSEIDEKIDLNNKVNNNLYEMGDNLYNEYFGKYKANLPSDYKIVKLNEVADNYDSKRKPMSSREREQHRGIYPYYGATSIIDYVDDYIFDDIYLLMGEDGTVKTNDGYPILQYIWGKNWINNHAHVLKGKNISTELLMFALRKINIENIITGAVQPKINQENMNKIEFVIGSDSKNKELEDILKNLMDKSKNIIEENKKLEELRDTLLPKLMNGEIDLDNIEI